ncbi:MAG: hypothetical protein CMG55_04130 [Candidatus Marinimicrobia bacterium]|nr:hypothetical protein [Candidatus Neomarinimicrobiota bacterium]|tara:strand:- start:2839 stop:4218 length:1380 start_codon:yes stop_codon:yes gene_type:complete
MKQIRIVIISFICWPIIGLSDPGDLVEYNFQNNLSISTINIFLNSIGSNSSNVLYPIAIYDIKYESIDENGIIDTLSGLISFPQSSIEAFPLLAYQHGTLILDSQAPSITGMSMNNLEILLVGLATTPSGLITVMPDYVGIGDPDRYHPYTIADPHTRALIDILRATKELSIILQNEYSFQFNEQLFLIGYSDGGYATLASQRGIEQNYYDEFTITASLPMAGPYDLSGTMVDYFLSEPEYSQPYYVPYVLTSHLWYYEGLDVDFNQYFEPFWADTLPVLFDGTHSGSDINILMPDNPLDILLPDVLVEFENNDNHFFRQTLEQNTLLDWIPQSPTYFFHGLGDDIVPYQNAQVAYDTFIFNGAQNINLTLYPVALGGHAEVAPICLSAGFDIILEYQLINLKGDLDGDSNISLLDLDILSSAVINQNELSQYQYWASDLDFNNNTSLFDVLMLIDLID